MGEIDNVRRPEPIRLDLGPGQAQIAGYTRLEIAEGRPAWPLTDYADNSVAEIRASHLLEHFSYRQTMDVLKDWVRALEPGGILRLAVPDLDKIIEAYQGDSDGQVEGYLMGGHADAHDVHLALFNEAKLRELMRLAGLEQIESWQSEAQDCSALPISLNLMGRKPELALPQPPAAAPSLRVKAVMSVPRLGFMDNFFCSFAALVPLKIPMRKQTGAYWGQCLTRAIEETLAEGSVDAILTIDYDTVFTRADVETLIRLMSEHPEADAIAALQASRSLSLPMFTIEREGKRQQQIARNLLDQDLLQVTTAHFGLTLIRVTSLREVPQPWFKGEPGADGRWGDDRTDDDIWFWRNWRQHGKTLYSANRVPVGHAELMVRWPGQDLVATYQHPSEFYADGKPKGAWK